MKKSILAILITTIVVVSIIFWFLFQKSATSNSEIFEIPIIAIIVGFGLYVGISRIKSERKGQPAEDELSRKLLTKASSVSFYASLYFLLLLMYLSDKTTLETHTMIGIGILGMAFLFVISWLFFKLKGLRDDE